MPLQGFGPEAKTRGGIIMVPAYKYLQIEISTYSMEFSLLPPEGFGPEAKTRGGIIMFPAYKYLQIEINTYSMEFSLCIWKKSRFAKSGRAV